MAVENFSLRIRAVIPRMELSERVSVAQISVASPLLATRDSQRGCVSQVIWLAGKVCRNADTAGKVWTISPSEPRRTTRNRGSGILILANIFQQRARGMIFGVAHDGHANTESRSGGTFGNTFRRVVRAFGMDVGTQLFEQTVDVRFRKNNYVVHAAKRRHQLSARLFVQNWALPAFQRMYGRVSVYRGD